MTVDFELSAEQRELQDMARRFAREEMAPRAAECDKKHLWPEEIYRKGWELGLMNVIVPAEYGGTGLGEFDECLITEELAYADSGMAITFGANCLALQPINIGGTPEQKTRILKPFCESFNVASFCLTEPSAGSDVAALKTTARKEGDHYVIDGEKCFITNAPNASLFTVFTTVDRTKAHKGITAFVVPKSTPGLTVGKDEDKMGQRASSTASIVFEGVQVPVENRLGQEGDGFKIAMATLDSTRTPVGALATGVAQAALDHAAKYSLQRMAFGKPIGEHQGIAIKLATMKQKVDAARLLTWRAAWLADQGKANTLESSISKCYASDMAMYVCNEAIQIFGGYGYMTEYPVEKLLRDAKLAQIYEGANEIQRIVIARELLKRYA
jgi:acyl-CoA dehydrogenase